MRPLGSQVDPSAVSIVVAPRPVYLAQGNVDSERRRALRPVGTDRLWGPA